MLRLIIDQLQGIGGSRSAGFGPNRVISLPDAVANALMEQYFSEEKVEQLALFAQNDIGAPSSNGGHENPTAYSNGIDHDETTEGYLAGAELCPSCRTVSLIRAEGCRKCLTCGYSEC
jgi:ribonucleoside-diphosphate reductase alpha chain